jgi:hypothetical protein
LQIKSAQALLAHGRRYLVLAGYNALITSLESAA